MYFIKNGKKVKYNPPIITQKHNGNFSSHVKEKNTHGKFPPWVFILLGLIASFIFISYFSL